MAITEKNKPKKTVQRGKSYLMHLVAKSPKSEFQIRQKLKYTDYEEAVIDEVIEFGKAYDYIDDKSYAIRWLNSNTASKKYGKIKCIQELKKKGISDHIITEQIEAYFEDEAVSEYQMALDYLNRKRHLIKGQKLFQKKQKASRILFQRGFTTDVINTVVTDFFEGNVGQETENGYQKRIF